MLRMYGTYMHIVISITIVILGTFENFVFQLSL